MLAGHMNITDPPGQYRSSYVLCFEKNACKILSVENGDSCVKRAASVYKCTAVCERNVRDRMTSIHGMGNK